MRLKHGSILILVTLSWLLIIFACTKLQAAVTWTPSDGLYQQQKTISGKIVTRYVKLTNEQVKALIATPAEIPPKSRQIPAEIPPIAVVDLNDGAHMNMPYVKKTNIPVGAMSKNYIDLIPAQYPPSIHTDPADANNGEFRVSCNFSHMLQDDPIVKPGQKGASHWHTFFGNSQTDANSTIASLMSSGSSSCDGGIMNRSAYWIPSMVDTRTGTLIAPSGGNFYYKTESANSVVSVPVGLKMVAGNMTSTSTQDHIHWWCADSIDNNVVGDQGYIPTCAPGDHLLAVINFPNFWDGVNLDSADHKSHVSYIHDSAHPVQIPDITFNIRYDVGANDDTSQWRLSSDMYDTTKKGGYSLHGDYMFGWSTDPKTSKNFSEIFWTGCLKSAVNCGNSLLGDGRQFQY